ncbi:hypothetical protein SALBM135S_01598 [Streptomyces alboniger]
MAFIQLMRQLKERSQLTYRELEERAAQNGDVLARSTLADIMRRTTLPRHDVLAAFVRACGDGPRADAWLAARDRIAADIAAASATGPAPAVDARPPTEALTNSSHRMGSAPDGHDDVTYADAAADVGRSAPVTDELTERQVDAVVQRPPLLSVPGTRWLPSEGRRMVVLVITLAISLLALAAWRVLPGRSGDPGAPAAASSASRTLVGGWVTIRPVSTPDLCLTDGRDRGGAYPSAVAVQLPCSQAPVPRTYLEPAGEGLHRIQWHHPQHGKGCLAVMGSGPVKDMLEPRENCGQATLFRMETTTVDGVERVQLQPTHISRCIGIVDNDSTPGAEAIAERCTGARDQQFLIRMD